MEIGIIGLGDMGKLYAREFSRQGYRVNGCDLPGRKNQLEQELHGTGVYVMDDGIAVSRRSDLIFYSVEAENIGSVVRQFGPSTKTGAIVAGQTSVKTPEIEAFKKYLPEDANIVTCHSLHGPTVSPVGQGLAVIRHRISNVPKFLPVVEREFGKDAVKEYLKHIEDDYENNLVLRVWKILRGFLVRI